MRNRELVLILCIGSSLLGCSSKPSESEIAAPTIEFWKGCAKVSDVTKTNGIEGEGGKTYRVSFTYKLEILEDGGGMLGTPPNCSMFLPNQQASQAGTLLKISMGSGPIKKGDVYTVSAEKDMIKSEKGWISQ